MTTPSDSDSVEETGFRFACHPGLACFTRCCANLNLVLTPYDILRLARRLALSSEQFLERHAAATTDATCGLPVVRLRMDPDSGRCPFLTPEGCTVYTDRPGACRLYPLGQALKQVPGGFRQYYFTVKEAHCLGWQQDKFWRLEQRFALDDDLYRRLGQDDEELLMFAGRWLEFALFGTGAVPRTAEAAPSGRFRAR